MNADDRRWLLAIKDLGAGEVQQKSKPCHVLGCCLLVQTALINQGTHMHERIRLHEQLVGTYDAQRDLRPLLKHAGVELIDARITAWRPDKREIDADGRTVTYDYVVCALGSSGQVDQLKTIGDEVTIVGGGLTGIELATEIAEHSPHKRVQLVTSGAVGESLSPSGRAHIRKTLGRLGVQLKEHTQVQHADIWANGFSINPLTRASGLPVNDKGQLKVDASLRSIADARVFVAGDAAAANCSMGCKTAMPMGAHVADAIVAAIHSKPMPEFHFADSIFCISLGRRDGLVQFLDKQGTAVDRVWTGRVAAWVKELICRYTRWSWQLQALGLLDYRWIRT